VYLESSSIAFHNILVDFIFSHLEKSTCNLNFTLSLFDHCYEFDQKLI
jgi:hypothetical protein